MASFLQKLWSPILTGLALTVVAVPTFADHEIKERRHTDWAIGIRATSSESHALYGHGHQNSEPFKVFISVEAGLKNKARGHHGRRGHSGRYSGRHGGHTGRPINHAQALILSSVEKYLPYGIKLVANRHYADMVIRLEERQYDLNFHVIDRDREFKKYKKRDRYGHGRCGYAKRAFYTEITERGVAHYAFDMKIRFKGDGLYHDHLYGKASEKFRYAKDLYAASNCGPVATDHVPSRKVAKLLYQAGPDYRKSVAREIRRESLYKTGAQLAELITYKATALQQDKKRYSHTYSHH